MRTNAFKSFVVLLCIFFSTAASAVTVSVISSGSVGRSDAYWAGIVMLDVDGQKMLGMFDTLASPDRWALPSTSSWEANLYTPRHSFLMGFWDTTRPTNCGQQALMKWCGTP